MFGKCWLLALKYPFLRNIFGIFRSEQDFENKSRGRVASDYRLLISSRLFPATFPVRELSYCFFKFLYDKFWIVYILPLYQSLDKRIWFTILFSSQRELHFVPNIDFFLLNYDLFCPNWSYAWLFEKFIFELEASHSFKITWTLVRQVISLKKNGGVISIIYCLVLWSPIYTPLILVSALMKMASTSTTVIYNSMRVDTPGERLIYKGKRIR